MPETGNADVLGAMRKLLLLLADQQKDVETILIDVQAVVSVTKEKNGPAYQKAKEDFQEKLKSSDAFGIEQALRQLSDELGRRLS
jgi:hypothetical protein